MSELATFRVYNGGVNLVFGVDSVLELRDVFKHLRKPLIVTGSRSARESGALGDILKLLSEAGVEYVLFDKARPNPTIELAEEAAEKWVAEECREFIAIGGGSVIDLAKSARAAVAGGGRVREYFYGLKTPPRVKPVLIAVNLTHGTGSEIDRFAVLSEEKELEKRGFPAGYPDYSVDDPKYTLTLPLDQTIYTTIDALSHILEGATSTASSPFVEALAEEASSRIAKYLPLAVRKPGDIEARYWLLYASMLGGIVIDHALTHLGHGLEHVLSAYNPRLPHGAGLAMIHSKLVEHIYRSRPVQAWRVLKYFDETLKPDPNDSARAREAFTRFLQEIGFKETLSDYGFTPGEVRRLFKLIISKNTYRRYIELAPFRVSEELIEEIAASIV
ncbi:iron-containing alcohol dehydrogenase [Thermogladius sp. 4427co]|uniref:iron-containing alcohol dehydrogenase n=1 Tax=Thermogladius sp. 4427co TaxID=3450718 RepID=UPI003F79AC75